MSGQQQSGQKKTKELTGLHVSLFPSPSLQGRWRRGSGSGGGQVQGGQALPAGERGKGGEGRLPTKSLNCLKNKCIR